MSHVAHEKLLEELGQLFEKEQNPFNDSGPRGGDPIGPTSLSGVDGTARGETGDWDCSCSNYSCTCKGKGDKAGQTKKFKVSKGYKGNYNSKYVSKYGAWRRKGEKKKKKAA